MAFVMDPIRSIDIRGDTTFALMLEAQRRGHRVFYDRSGRSRRRERRVFAKVFPVTLRREHGNHAEVGEPHVADLDAEMQIVFQRKDPPVDEAYVTATQILALLKRARVWNRPAGILAANEKLYALHFADLMPETLVARETARFLDFLEEMGGEMIVKPLGGRGGEGIFHVRRDDRNLFSILEQTTRFGTRLAMAQRYLPDVRSGDKRILLLEGEPLGAVLRVPAEGENRANLHVGGRPAEGRARRGRPPHHRSAAPLARARRPPLRRHRRDRRPAHRGERHQPDGDPGDERPRRRPLRGARARAGRAEALADGRRLRPRPPPSAASNSVDNPPESLLTPSEARRIIRASVGGSSPAPTVLPPKPRLPVAGKTQPTEKEWSMATKVAKPESSERRAGSTTSTRRGT